MGEHKRGKGHLAETAQKIVEKAILVGLISQSQSEELVHEYLMN